MISNYSIIKGKSVEIVQSATNCPIDVCILMYSPLKKIHPYVVTAAEINKIYAQRHGYTFKYEIIDESSRAELKWSRVRLIRDLLPKYRAIFYLDGDAVFNNHSMRLDKYLNEPGDIVVCSDHPNSGEKLNIGAFLIKRTEWSVGFMDIWYKLKDNSTYQEHSYDQKAISDLLTANQNGEGLHFSIYHASEFNSDIKKVLSGGQRDSFVLHFMDSNTTYRETELLKVLEAVKEENATAIVC